MGHVATGDPVTGHGEMGQPVTGHLFSVLENEVVGHRIVVGFWQGEGDDEGDEGNHILRKKLKRLHRSTDSEDELDRNNLLIDLAMGRNKGAKVKDTSSTALQ